MAFSTPNNQTVYNEMQSFWNYLRDVGEDIGLSPPEPLTPLQLDFNDPVSAPLPGHNTAVTEENNVRGLERFENWDVLSTMEDPVLETLSERVQMIHVLGHGPGYIEEDDPLPVVSVRHVSYLAR